MKKTEFLMLLRQKLSILPKQEQDETLEYYSEMIDDYIESGYTPEQAVAQMGGVENIAAQVLAGSHPPVYEAHGVQKRKQTGLLWLAILGFPIWLPLLIVAFCVLLVFAVVLVVLGIVVPWVLVIAFGASALGLLVSTPIICVGEGVPSMIFTLGAAFVLGALCIFSLWVALRTTKLSAKGVGVMFKGFFKLLLGRR